MKKRFRLNIAIIRLTENGKDRVTAIFKATGFLFIKLTKRHIPLLFNVPALTLICFNLIPCGMEPQPSLLQTGEGSPLDAAVSKF